MNLLKPTKYIKPLPENQIDDTYKRLRLQVLLGIFTGYAGYHLLCKNFLLAMPALQEQGFTKAELGFAPSVASIAYGFSKFFMGTVSDRSNARIFLVLGLVLTAIVNLLMGFVPFLTSGIGIMFVLLFLNGWLQGMGWPPSGRVLVHWFSVSEYGSKTAFWSVAHNVGGGIMAPIAAWGIITIALINFDCLKGFEGVFIYSAPLVLITTAISYILIRDTPQSQGLPPIEIYKNDFVTSDKKALETKLTTREILFKYVPNNKWVRVIASTNIFVYFVRYDVFDWASAYLSEGKHFDLKTSGWAYFLYEWAGIPGILLCGYTPDKLFKGRRGPTGFFFVLGVTVFALIYWLDPLGSAWLGNVSLITIGFLIYGLVMLIGLQASDYVPRKAAGTAAGLTGLFGYLFGAVMANIVLGAVVDRFGWDVGSILLTAISMFVMLSFILTWNKVGQETVHH